MKELIISSEKDLILPIEYLNSECTGCRIFCLKGELGAGKTTFVKKMLSKLGVQDDVTSPTYSIINEYKYDKGVIYHLDLYRLNTIEEALEIGIEEYLQSDNYCFIEWYELIEPLLPNNCVKIEIDAQEDSSRKFIISNLRM